MNDALFSKKGTNESICTFYSLLTRQGSNLDSSEPKSDVLPVTPRVNHCSVFFVKTVQKYKNFPFAVPGQIFSNGLKPYICGYP
jgi:hypothetical protein